MKLEDAGFPRWGTRYASYWPPFVSLRSSLWSLWAALTHLASFAFQPGAVNSPPAIRGPLGIQLLCPLLVSLA
jgi:hypothetical protein